MSKKHTPGMWMVKKIASGEYRILPADAYGNTRSDGPIGDVFEAYGCRDANASLIAAAPDLLEALKGLVEQVAFEWRIYDLMNIDDEMAKARAAIAKAETVHE